MRPPSTPRPRADGRTRLLDTAERLLDEHGIDGVSLRTLTAAAGHRNASAVHYHFGNRDQLILGVIERRQSVVEEQRTRRLDALEATSAGGDVSPQDALAAAIEPLAELLDDVAGRRYLRLLFQAVVHPAFYDRAVGDYSESMARVIRHLSPLIEHLSPAQRVTRLRLALGTALFAIADQARLVDDPAPARPVLDRETFTADLLAAVGALLAA